MDPADLYGLPLDRFIPERGALAKALRAEGKRDEAAEVAKLRKPSVAAWAVNQVVRTQGKAVRDLYDAGDALRKAQTDLLAGKGDARGLRKATDRERRAVDGLVDAARGLLTSDGHELSTTIIERVSETLNAAALDEAARERVREGTLERELRHVGFGLGDGEVALAPPARSRAAAEEKPTKKKPKTVKAHRDKQAARDREAERKQAAERRAERKQARDAETAARRRLERAQRALETAEGRHERAAAAFAKAENALAAARSEAEAALAEHELAKTRLETASTD